MKSLLLPTSRATESRSSVVSCSAFVGIGDGWRCEKVVQSFSISGMNRIPFWWSRVVVRKGSGGAAISLMRGFQAMSSGLKKLIQVDRRYVCRGSFVRDRKRRRANNVDCKMQVEHDVHRPDRVAGHSNRSIIIDK